MFKLTLISTIITNIVEMISSIKESKADKAKKPWQSKTLIGLFVATIAQMGSMFGYEFSSEFIATLTDVILQSTTFVGIMIAAFGRIKAQAPIKVKDNG